MKRRWKVFWIVCIVLAGMGIILCTAGIGLGLTFDSLKEYAVIYDYNGRYYANADRELQEESEQIFEGIQNLHIDVEAESVEIVEGDLEPGEIRVQTSELHPGVKLSMQKEDDRTLLIKTKSNLRRWRNEWYARIYIIVPKGMEFDEVSSSIGAGSLNVENIHANSLEVETGAGEIDIQEFTTKEFDVDCSTGNIYVQGDAKEEININCSVGNVVYIASGSYEDYNYDLNCNIGEIELDGNVYSGFDKTKEIDQGQSKEMNIECSIGKISVSFAR